MNKRGDLGNQTMTIMFVFFLVMISSGIAGGIFIFYGSGNDARGVEAQQLSSILKNCIEQGRTDEISIRSENFFSECGLYDKVIKKDYTIQIKRVNGETFYSFNNPEACQFEGVRQNNDYPVCYKLNARFEGKDYEIISGSNQKPRSVN